MRFPVVTLAIVVFSTGCAETSHTRADELRVDAGDEAAACDALRESHACPEDVNAESNLRMLSEEGSLFCEVECIQRRAGERIRTGAYVLENVSTAGLRVQGEYAQNERQGVWTTTTRCEVPNPDCRVIIQQETYDAGTRHGAFREFWGDGSPRVVGAFHRGAEHGSWVRTTRSGTVIARESLREGVKIGEQVYAYSDGKPRRVERYDQEGLPHGEWCFYRDDETKIDCFELVHGTGTIREYTDDGQLISVKPKKNGALHGEQIDYLQGQPSKIERFVDGKNHGVSEYFQGQCLSERVTFRDGLEHGEYASFDCPDDVIHDVVTGTYCAGHKCGRWTRSEGIWIQAQLFDEKGNLIGEESFEDGVLIESWNADELRAQEHQNCLDELARGGCCDPEQGPPPGAKQCVNGDKR